MKWKIYILLNYAINCQIIFTISVMRMQIQIYIIKYILDYLYVWKYIKVRKLQIQEIISSWWRHLWVS